MRTINNNPNGISVNVLSVSIFQARFELSRYIWPVVYDDVVQAINEDRDRHVFLRKGSLIFVHIFSDFIKLPVSQASNQYLAKICRNIPS